MATEDLIVAFIIGISIFSAIRWLFTKSTSCKKTQEELEDEWYRHMNDDV